MYALCMISPHRSPEIMEVEHLARCLGHRRCSVNVVFINNDDNPHSSPSGLGWVPYLPYEVQDCTGEPAAQARLETCTLSVQR